MLVSRAGSSCDKFGDPEGPGKAPPASSYRGIRKGGNAARRHLGAGYGAQLPGEDTRPDRCITLA